MRDEWITKFLDAIDSDPSIGADRLLAVVPFDNPEAAAYAIGDLLLSGFPVPPYRAVQSLRVLRTLVDYLRAVNG